ncbi:C6 zinc finger domain-containing protein [Ilyonectria destructans]|nr:C6 zinc finger domain-containing protein [Ilyonectria destructans]
MYNLDVTAFVAPPSRRKRRGGKSGSATSIFRDLDIANKATSHHHGLKYTLRPAARVRPYRNYFLFLYAPFRPLGNRKKSCRSGPWPGGASSRRDQQVTNYQGVYYAAPPSMEAVPDTAVESPASGLGTDTDAKRRRIRKGTRSCWECKRRKVRCSYSTPSASVCIGCDRRGSSCVSQAYPEEAAPATSAGGRGRQMGDRIVRVEALIEQLVRRAGDQSNVSTARTGSSVLSRDEPSEYEDPNTAFSIPGSIDDVEATRVLPVRKPPTPDFGLEDSHPVASYSSPVLPTPQSITPLKRSDHSRGPLYGDISAALHAALPPRKDIDLMIKAGLNISFDKLMMQPHAVLAQKPGGGRADLEKMPEATAHPALIAKYLLVLATCFQYVNPELHAEEIRCLSEPPHQLMHRLADTAYTLVINNDDFLGSVEFLECVMLEAFFQANSGNLRRAWFGCRRGMVVAQMMGLHRSGSRQTLKVVGPTEPLYPNYIWFRIVWADRQLCLMLGLPQGSLDVSIASEVALAGDTLSDQFERKQSVIASRIIERNESSDPAVMEDFAALQELDAELQKTANEMGSKWWLPPTLANIHDPEEAFWETLRLLEQMIYFNLLNMLHLPYMLRSSAPGESTTGYNLEYSKLSSVNASRELLTRFIMFRSFNRVAFCSRATDFHALIAAMTLVIAHLDGHRKQRQQGAGMAGINLLAHQRNSDRAMMDQVLENMEGVAKLSTDVLSERSSSLLKSLLALEADAANGKFGNAAAVMTELHPDSATDDGHSLRISIPYFGTIQISREGALSMEAPRCTTPPSPVPQRHPNAKAASLLPATSASNASYMADPAHQATQIPPAAAQRHQPFAPQFSSAINDALQRQYSYPGLTAGVDDWAFQGVDMTFFDSLMRGSEAENMTDEGGLASWEDAA